MFAQENTSSTVISSTTPSPATLITSTVSVSTLRTTTPEAKKPSNISSSSDNNNCSMKNENVYCTDIPVKDIKAFFQRTDDLITHDLLDTVELTLLRGNEWIPADILGNKKTKYLTIQYNASQAPVGLLKVDVNAFEITKNYTKSLTLRNFNSGQLDLGFLSGFNQLTELKLEKLRHIQKSLTTLPLLPKLTSLEFYDVTGLNESITSFPTLSTGGLKTFKFRSSGMHSDASVSRMLDWILLSSGKTLEALMMDNIGITEIPSQISSFTALNYLDLDGNSISTIKNGALRFSVPVSKLRLWSNKINSIEPGAFRGDFRNAYVKLEVNPFTRFDESVFRPMVEQMVSGTGYIDIEYGTRIDCSIDNSCHLAWLIRDSNVRSKVFRGRCSNGTLFSDLSKNGFNHCPVTKKP